MRTACSWLFVPGSRPDRFERAHDSGAGAVVLDLEDAVDPGDRDRARADVAAWVAEHPAWVRVNGVGTRWHDEDLAAIAAAPGLAGVMVPKAEDPEGLTIVADHVGRPVVALVESARGLLRAGPLAECDGVTLLALGGLDLARDVRADPIGPLLDHARAQLVLASAAAGIAAPVDAVWPRLGDTDGLAHDARRARALGLRGKLCVHPDQVPTINDVMAPSPEELRWARRVLERLAIDGGLFALDGELIDGPVIARARAVVAEAGASPAHR